MSAPVAAGRGLFLTVEGIDGSGKSTQARRLAARLRAEGRAVVETREPGGTPGAEALRALLVEGEAGRWAPESEILLFTAARIEHVARLIRPALAAGRIVICDRYVDSTRAYQGAEPARRALIDDLHRSLVGLDPDRTLLFEIDAERAGERLAARGAPDRIEGRGTAFQRALAARFAALAEAEPDRIRRIGADAPEDAVAERVRAALDPLLAMG